jgi:hypothetical protein
MLPTCEQIENGSRRMDARCHPEQTPRVDAPTGELLGDRSSGASALARDDLAGHQLG